MAEPAIATTAPREAEVRFPGFVLLTEALQPALDEGHTLAELEWSAMLTPCLVPTCDERVSPVVSNQSAKRNTNTARQCGIVGNARSSF